MENKVEVTCTQLEIGPHFLTFYIDNKSASRQARKECYDKFCEQLPELGALQPKAFSHEANDPNIFHPFAVPAKTHTPYHHFHIKFGPKKVTMAHFKMVKPILEDFITFPDDLKVIKLEDNKEEGKEDLRYPEIPEGWDYEKYISELRQGDWIKNNGIFNEFKDKTNFCNKFDVYIST